MEEKRQPKKILTRTEKRAIYNKLMKIFVHGRLTRGSVTITLFKLKVDHCRNTNIWKTCLEEYAGSHLLSLIQLERGEEGERWLIFMS